MTRVGNCLKILCSDDVIPYVFPKMKCGVLFIRSESNKYTNCWLLLCPAIVCCSKCCPTLCDILRDLFYQRGKLKRNRTKMETSIQRLLGMLMNDRDYYCHFKNPNHSHRARCI